MTVYIVVSRRRYLFSNMEAIVDSVYDSEEKAWKRIEELYYDYVNVVLTKFSITKVSIRKNTLQMWYEDFIEDLYGDIKYTIEIKDVN